jgi:hypothetical protein
MKLKLVLLFAAPVILISLVAVAAPVALAGSDGQQLIVSTNASTNSVKISGDNQIGKEVHQTLNTPTGTTEDSGYWWENTVEITSYTGTNGSGTDIETVSCDVPVSQGSNWFNCNAS